METTESGQGGRVYRVIEKMSNGVVLLEATDDEPRHHRRFLSVAMILAPVVPGDLVTYYEESRIAAPHRRQIYMGEESTIESVLGAAIDTLAQLLHVPPQDAARRAASWLVGGDSGHQ